MTKASLPDEEECAVFGVVLGKLFADDIESEPKALLGTLVQKNGLAASYRILGELAVVSATVWDALPFEVTDVVDRNDFLEDALSIWASQQMPYTLTESSWRWIAHSLNEQAAYRAFGK